MLTAQHIQDKIALRVPNAQVVVYDTTGTGDHFRAEVISSAFAGLSRVDQHRLIYDAVREELADGSIHALSLQTQLPGN